MDETSPCVKLAFDAIETYVREGRIIPPPEECPPDMREQSGVFVCIKKYGELRGCIGTIEPAQHNIAEEIIHNAVSAAIRDPRFLPVEPEELEVLTCSVDILTPPEPVEGLHDLDASKYGVVVECGERRGLLLPDLDGVETAEHQVSIACRKAMIRPGEPVELYRFEVKRYY